MMSNLICQKATDAFLAAKKDLIMKNYKEIIISGSFGLLIGLSFFFYHAWAGGDSCRMPGTIDINAILNESDIVPAVVIGSGPAGNSAALYLSRAGIGQVLVLTGSKPGGLLTETTWVENWPGIPKEMGPKIMQASKEQAQAAGAQFVFATVESVDFNSWPFLLTTDAGQEIKTLSVVIATGASPRKLGVPGEEKYWGGGGVTSCAKCDAPFFKNKDVIVIGGGDSAVEEASILSPFAKSVTIFVRKDKMRAQAASQEHLKKLDNVTIRYNHELKKIMGDDSDLNAIEVLNNKTHETTQEPMNGVFYAIGHDPNIGPFKDQIVLHEGYIKVFGRSQKTSVCGVFAAGDVEDPEYKQAGSSAGDGIKAGLDAVSFLHGIGLNKKVSDTLRSNFSISFDDGTGNVTIIKSIKEFEKEVLGAKDKVVAMDFYADYCPSCMQMLPIYQQVSSQFEGRVKFTKVDIDVAEDLVRDARIKVRKIPCLLVFMNDDSGKKILAARHYDVMNRKEMIEYIDQFVE